MTKSQDPRDAGQPARAANSSPSPLAIRPLLNGADDKLRPSSRFAFGSSGDRSSGDRSSGDRSSGDGASVNGSPGPLLIVGRGRLAQTLLSWPKSSTLGLCSWHRDQGLEELDRALFTASHVLLAIRDDALEGFVKTHATRLRGKTLVHFAGSRGDLLIGNSTCYVAHPLVSLSHTPPPLELLQTVPFSISGARPLTELLPGFSNSSFVIGDQDRALYHALLSFGGNLSVWLWERMEREFASQFSSASPHLKKSELQSDFDATELRTYLDPYLQSLFWALGTRQDGRSALTGPLTRGDLDTVARQSSALQQRTDLQPVFTAICDRILADRNPSRPQTMEQNL